MDALEMYDLAETAAQLSESLRCTPLEPLIEAVVTEYGSVAPSQIAAEAALQVHKRCYTGDGYDILEWGSGGCDTVADFALSAALEGSLETLPGAISDYLDEVLQ